MSGASPPQYSLVSDQESSPSLRTNHPNASAYTLATIHGNTTSTSPPRSDRAPLLSPATPSYGATTPISPGVPGNSRKVLLNAAIKMAALFVLSTLLLGGTLWLALPTVDEDDRSKLRVPKSFAQLQDLNHLLKKYRDIYPYRIFVCYVIAYLFLQAFSLPGSMYLSILGGAVWGVPRALPLACTCVACGATLCYLISAALGPAILVLPKWKARLDTWSTRIAGQRDNLISYLIILRIAPLPPHWVVNVLSPHLGIGLVPFWVSTFFGVLGVSVIHTTIGGGLDEMTSADDFHLISWRNFFGLSAVVVGVLIPVGLRFVFKRQVAPEAELDASGDEGQLAGEGFEDDEGGDVILEQGPLFRKNKGKKPDPQLVMLSDSDSEDLDGDAVDEEEDEILDAGPVVIPEDRWTELTATGSHDRSSRSWSNVSF